MWWKVKPSPTPRYCLREVLQRNFRLHRCWSIKHNHPDCRDRNRNNDRSEIPFGFSCERFGFSCERFGLSCERFRVKMWQVRVKLWQVRVKIWQVRVKFWQVRVKLWQSWVKLWPVGPGKSWVGWVATETSKNLLIVVFFTRILW